MAYTKSWDNRAARDLFFAILTVKNILIVSRADWAEIGAIMRSKGYGFTNEGCRQQFQGFRRAQQKSNEDGSGAAPPTPNPASPAEPNSTDPHLDPIHRRGKRGRPGRGFTADSKDDPALLSPTGPYDTAESPIVEGAEAENDPRTGPTPPSAAEFKPSLVGMSMAPAPSQTSLAAISDELHANVDTPLARTPLQTRRAPTTPNKEVHSHHLQPQQHRQQSYHMGHISQDINNHRSPASHIHRLHIDDQDVEGTPPSKRLKTEAKTQEKIDDDALDDEAVLSLAAADPPPDQTSTFPPDFETQYTGS